MCAPMAIMAVAAAASAAGAMANSNAQAKAITSNNQLQADEQGRAIRRAVDVSRDEFDSRVARQDELNRLIQNDQRTGFDERIGAERTFSDTQNTARTDALSLYEQALEALAGKRQTAVDDANRIIQAERDTQSGYRRQADEAVDRTIGLAGQGIAGQQADAARRGELVTDAVSAAPVSLVPAGNAIVAADADAQARAAVGRATADGTRAASLSSYAEVPRTFARESMGLGDVLSGLGLRSDITRSGLQSALAVPRTQVINATEDARGGIDRAQTDMENRVQLGDMLRKGTIGRSSDYENAVVGARQQYGEAADATSRLFEQRMGVVVDNNARANIAKGTTYPNMMLGTLLQAGGSIAGAAAQGMGSKWSSFGDWFRTPASAGMNGGWYGGNANGPAWR